MRRREHLSPNVPCWGHRDGWHDRNNAVKTEGLIADKSDCPSPRCQATGWLALQLQESSMLNCPTKMGATPPPPPTHNTHYTLCKPSNKTWIRPRFAVFLFAVSRFAVSLFAVSRFAFSYFDVRICDFAARVSFRRILTVTREHTQ